MIYSGQDFSVQGTSLVVTGKQVLDQLYGNRDVNAWGMLGVLVAYILFFRAVHYGLFLYASLPYLTGAQPQQQQSEGAGKKTTLPHRAPGEAAAAYEPVKRGELELV